MLVASLVSRFVLVLHVFVSSSLVVVKSLVLWWWFLVLGPHFIDKILLIVLGLLLALFVLRPCGRAMVCVSLL